MSRRRSFAYCLAFAALLGLGVAWSQWPPDAWTSLAAADAWVREAGGRPWIACAVLAAYTPASMILFPRPLITLFAVAAFGPWLGFAFAFTGIMIAAVVTYVLGRALIAEVRSDQARLARVREVLARRGVLAVTAVRLVPIAPFAVVNAVAGAMRIRLTHFVAGSALGILPGTATATLASEQVAVALRHQESLDLYVIAAALAGLAGATLVLRGWLSGRWQAR